MAAAVEFMAAPFTDELRVMSTSKGREHDCFAGLAQYQPDEPPCRENVVSRPAAGGQRPPAVQPRTQDHAARAGTLLILLNPPIR